MSGEVLFRKGMARFAVKGVLPFVFKKIRVDFEAIDAVHRKIHERLLKNQGEEKKEEKGVCRKREKKADGSAERNGRKKVEKDEDGPHKKAAQRAFGPPEGDVAPRFSFANLAFERNRVGQKMRKKEKREP